MSRNRHLGKILYIGAILTLALVIMISGLRILESTVFMNGQLQDSPIKSRTITRNGVEYYPRQDITVLMVLGIDESGPVKDSGSYNNPGTADMVTLLIFDNTAKIYHVLCLNRDTMVQMPVLGVDGKQAGTYFGQLALSHTYGSGLKDSCENTKKTVSDLLYGLYIDYYVAMNMDAIAILNDAVGGVTVSVTDDFSAVDETITQGEVTLKGEQAIHYVQTRKGVGDQLNISRIERQKEYMTGFLAAFRSAREQDVEFIASTYETVDPYIVSDCSLETLTNLANRCADYSLSEMISPEGDNIQGEEYYEFHLDEEKLDELILRLLYAPK